MPTTTKPLEEFQGHKVYIRIVLLGCILHLTHVVFFGWLNCPIPFFYNIGSTLFYIVMIYFINKKMYRFVVSCVHIEVTLFIINFTLSCGWECGASLYFFAFVGMVYFCPFDRKIIAYLIAVAEVAIFFLLHSVVIKVGSIYDNIPKTMISFFYFYNAICSFAVILFSAYMSNVSATVTNKRLLAENRNLSVIANFDFLTGLLSRRGFQDKLNECPKENSIVIALGDLDNFKQINDTYSHNAGDYVLQTVSKLIANHCSTETIPCRWGGEEFIFLFQNADVALVAEELQNLCDAIANHPFIFNDTRLPITMTFGISAQSDIQQAHSLISEADSRLYQGKAFGKNRVIAPEPI